MTAERDSRSPARRAWLLPGRRISVIGTSGSGKTYVAQALAGKLNLTYICNDAIIIGPNWESAPRDRVFSLIEEATRADSWTFDGNLSLSRPEDRLVLERCDTLVWLDLPRWQTHLQVLRRTLTRVLTGATVAREPRELADNAQQGLDHMVVDQDIRAPASRVPRAVQ